MNVTLIIIASIILLLLLVWIIIANKKDKNLFVDKLNKDFPVREKHTENSDPDDVKGD